MFFIIMELLFMLLVLGELVLISQREITGTDVFVLAFSFLTACVLRMTRKGKEG